MVAPKVSENKKEERVPAPRKKPSPDKENRKDKENKPKDPEPHVSSAAAAREKGSGGDKHKKEEPQHPEGKISYDKVFGLDKSKIKLPEGSKWSDWEDDHVSDLWDMCVYQTMEEEFVRSNAKVPKIT